MELTERQQECVEAYERNFCSEKAASEELGIGIKALRSNLWLAHRKGWMVQPDNFIEDAPAGFVMTHGTMHIKDGKVVQHWPRIKPGAANAEDFANYLRQRTPVSNFKAPRVRPETGKKFMLEWPIYDPHHGMLSWAEETGADYDHKISRHLQISAGKIIAQSFGKVAKMTVLAGGDTQTADNRQGRTEKSGNYLDTDSRYQKMAWAAHEATVAVIEIACNIADEVEVIVLPGNHDNDSSAHLIIQLHAYFRNIAKVKINTSPEPHKFYRWGTNVFMATHGNMPEKRMATFMLNQIIDRGLAKNCKRKMVRCGHIHQKGSKTPDPLTEQDGVLIERFPTLAAPEAYSVEAGYVNMRATSVNLWHRDYGRYGGRDITIGEILNRYPF